MSTNRLSLSYAETVVRASQMTGHESVAEFEEAEEAQRLLREQGYDAEFQRFLDDAGCRWRLLLHTPRGNIPVLLDRPSGWRLALQERGLL